MFDNQTREELLYMTILVKNQTFGHQFGPFSDQFSQKGPNLDQVRPIRTISGNTASLHLWYGENSGKEALGVPRDLLYGTQLQHHQDVLLHSGVYGPPGKLQRVC